MQRVGRAMSNCSETPVIASHCGDVYPRMDVPRSNASIFISFIFLVIEEFGNSKGSTRYSDCRLFFLQND